MWESGTTGGAGTSTRRPLSPSLPTPTSGAAMIYVLPGISSAATKWLSEHEAIATKSWSTVVLVANGSTSTSRYGRLLLFLLGWKKYMVYSLLVG